MSFATVGDELAALPLASLPAVSLDLETTGLEVLVDRVVEVAAVRIRHGAVDPLDRYVSLVNPGVPIPAMSTAVHRLSDADVADAIPFQTMIASLARWAGPSLVIGYSIGFDLAILEIEHNRRGMAWRAPASLDVRPLVRLLAPRPTPPSLEAAARWLGLAVEKRHHALADAILAAHVYLALLPMLAAQGIVTLQQAEDAARSDAAT